MDPLDKKPLSLLNDQPWYKKGLRFHCTQCGKCCIGAGVVRLTQEDITRLLTHLNLSREAFLKTYTKQLGRQTVLLDHPGKDECIFLKDKTTCSIYKNRPKQCRLFPWWPSNLRSKAAWQNMARECEGIDHPDAPLIPLEQIEKKLI